MKYRNILCPVDDSKATEKALETAEYLSRVSNSNLILLNVVEKWRQAEPVATDSREWQALHDEWLQEGQCLLDRAAARFNGSGLKSVETVLKDGDAAYEIVAVAKRRLADLIVMGSRRHSQVSKIFLGSVIDSVTRNAPCPVLWVME